MINKVVEFEVLEVRKQKNIYIIVFIRAELYIYNYVVVLLLKFQVHKIIK